jgi:hypothetical protein
VLGPPGLWEPEGVYLDTASYGLPPRPAWEALQAALADWRVGRTSWEGWCEATERARELFARLVGVEREQHLDHLAVERRVHRVALVGPVELDPGDPAIQLHPHCLPGHHTLLHQYQEA